MASAFGHIVAAIGLNNLFTLKNPLSKKVWITAIICSVLPDADVISFSLGIPYESMWGHRGISHSLVFALGISILFGILLEKERKKQILAFFVFLIATLSHSLLDALTTGGLGVAFWAPFNNERYFLPWQFIKVSPIGLSNFISAKGINVLKSEFIAIGIPTIITFILLFLKKKLAK